MAAQAGLCGSSEAAVEKAALLRFSSTKFCSDHRHVSCVGLHAHSLVRGQCTIMVLAFLAGSSLGTVGGVGVGEAAASRVRFPYMPQQGFGLSSARKQHNSHLAHLIGSTAQWEQARASPLDTVGAPAHRPPAARPTARPTPASVPRPPHVQLGIALLNRFIKPQPYDYLHSVDMAADDDDSVPMPQTVGMPVSFFKKKLLQACRL